MDLRLRPSLLFRDPPDLLGGNIFGQHLGIDNSEIATLAGNGSNAAGYQGDASWAALALLNSPEALDVVPEQPLRLDGLPNGHDMTKQGSILIADTVNHRVRELTPDGRIWNVAGTGQPGFKVRDPNGILVSGNQRPAIRAELSSPVDIAALPDGAFLIVDQGNNMIRKVNKHGIIRTIAGGRIQGYNGDTDSQGNRRLAIAAHLDQPSGIMLDGRRYLIADTGNQVIRRVDRRTRGGKIRTIAGTPNVPFSDPENGIELEDILPFPTRIATQTDGKLLISSPVTHLIYQRDNQGNITVVAGTQDPNNPNAIPDPPEQPTGDGGPPTQAHLDTPIGILGSRRGFLIADSAYDQIRRVKRLPNAGVVMRRVAGTGQNHLDKTFHPRKQTHLNRPHDIAHHPEGTLIADSNNNAIRFINKRYN